MKTIVYGGLLLGAFASGYYLNKTNINKINNYLKNNPSERKEIFFEARKYMDQKTLDSLRLSEMTKEDIYGFKKTEKELDNIKDKSQTLEDKIKTKGKKFLKKLDNALDELKN